MCTFDLKQGNIGIDSLNENSIYCMLHFAVQDVVSGTNAVKDIVIPIQLSEILEAQGSETFPVNSRGQIDVSQLIGSLLQTSMQMQPPKNLSHTLIFDHEFNAKIIFTNKELNQPP